MATLSDTNQGLTAPVEGKTTKLRAQLYDFVQKFKEISPEGFGRPQSTSGHDYSIKTASEFDAEKLKSSLVILNEKLNGSRQRMVASNNDSQSMR